MKLQEKISKGENLSDAMARYPKIFNELFVNMIKVGEESGTLDDIFQILSLQLGKEHELKSKIKNAMTYPAIIVMVMLCVAGFRYICVSNRDRNGTFSATRLHLLAVFIVLHLSRQQRLVETDEGVMERNCCIQRLTKSVN